MDNKFTSLQIRVSEEEKKSIRDYFGSRSINLSEWIRKKIKEEMEPRQ